MSTTSEATVWVVAGCLFEVSLPAGEHWRWANPRPEVTLLADGLRQAEHHFRFRGEAAGANAGVIELRFRSKESGPDERRVAVRIAPEQMTGS